MNPFSGPLSTKQNVFMDSLLQDDEFTITYELVPGHAPGGRRVDRLLEFAEKAGADGRIKALSVTDNAGGHPALAPIALGAEIQKIGIEPLIHFSLKDKNRNQVASHIFLYHRRNFHSLLVLGGDFPKQSYYGQAKPVFDLDSVQTLQLFQDMRKGKFSTRQDDGEEGELAQLRFFSGCVVSPFKTTESEQVWQYEKLLCKVKAGAKFVITQVGYDLLKYEELIRFCQITGIKVPILGNIFIPSLGVARYMAKGGVPGIFLSKQLVTEMEREVDSFDHGEKIRLIRAAKMIAMLRKQGYAGVHLGGNQLGFDEIRFVLDEAEGLYKKQINFSSDIHFPLPETWYYFRSDLSEKREKYNLTPLQRWRKIQPMFLINRILHQVLFTKTSLVAMIFGKFCCFCATGKRKTFFLTRIERMIKRILFSCRMCGDCTLEASSYLCPQSGCPKTLLNGPCGGSRFGTCEVYPDRRCFYVDVYERDGIRKGKTGSIGLNGCARETVPPKDWSKDQTSSWINYFRR